MVSCGGLLIRHHSTARKSGARFSAGRVAGGNSRYASVTMPLRTAGPCRCRRHVAHERELAVATDPIDHETGGSVLISLPSRIGIGRMLAATSTARQVDPEGAQMDAVAFDGLDQRRSPVC